MLPFQETAVTMWRGGDLMEKPCEVCRAKVAAWIGKAKRWWRDLNSLLTFATAASALKGREDIAQRGMVKVACRTVHCTPVKISMRRL